MCVKPSVHIPDISSNILFGRLYYKEGKVSILQRMNDINIHQDTHVGKNIARNSIITHHWNRTLTQLRISLW